MTYAAHHTCMRYGDACMRYGDACMRYGDACMSSGDACMSSGDACMRSAAHMIHSHTPMSSAARMILLPPSCTFYLLFACVWVLRLSCVCVCV